jgi:6-pyruvoyltetrahydropterin/6-carboxytetrahydropterin synthase
LLLPLFLLLLLLALGLLLLPAILPSSSLRRGSGTLLLALLPSGFLLELLDLALHEAAPLRILLHAQRIVTAVGTALPAFGIRAVATTAENAFRKGHLKNGRIVHFRPRRDPMDESRRKTLETLIALAQDSNPSACWDDRRAEDLLRSQSTPEELRTLGASEGTIEHIFGNALNRVTLRGSFSVRVEARFEAAHYLREYRGISEPLHGHSYKVEAELAARGGGVDGDAIAVDFVSAKRKLEALAKKLDYGCINDVAPFTEINPSAENIASWFQRELSAAVADENAIVTAVTIWEGPVNSVTFKPERA